LQEKDSHTIRSHKCKPAFLAAVSDLLTSSMLPVQAKKAQQLHDDKIAMARTLAENDANIKAKKKAAKQQVRRIAHLLVISLFPYPHPPTHPPTHPCTHSLTYS